MTLEMIRETGGHLSPQERLEALCDPGSLQLMRSGVMSRGAIGTSFNPAATVNRADLAVVLVRALGLEQQAQARMNEDLSGRTIDAAQIPADARGFVAVALDLGLLNTFPAGLVEIAPGQYQAMPGPRFEPATVATRAQLAPPIALALVVVGHRVRIGDERLFALVLDPHAVAWKHEQRVG